MEYYATGDTVSVNEWTHVAVSYIPDNVLYHDCVTTIYPDPDRNGKVSFLYQWKTCGCPGKCYENRCSAHLR